MTVLASDKFNRANANPIGAPWTTITGEVAMQIVSNAATPSNLAADNGVYYSGISWPGNHYSKAKLSLSGSAGSGSGASLHARVQAAANTYYRMSVDHAATNNVTLDRNNAGVFTTLTGFPLTLAWTDGDTWEIWAIDNQVWVMRNGLLVGSKVTDASPLAGGAPGFGYSSTETSCSIDDWEGGTPGGPVQLLGNLFVGPIGFGR